MYGTIKRYKKKVKRKIFDTIERDTDVNISKAKEYIKDTVKIYLKKDEFGDYKIPVVRQRPIFLFRRAWNWKNSDYGTDSGRNGDCACFLFDDASYKTVGVGTAVYQSSRNNMER